MLVYKSSIFWPAYEPNFHLDCHAAFQCHWEKEQHATFGVRNDIVFGVANDIWQLCVNTVLFYYETLLKDKDTLIISVWEEQYTPI